MATPFLNLELPVVTTTLGPEWANQVNAALEVIDGHDHTSSKGKQIPTAGLNINEDLDIQSNALLNVNYINLETQTSVPSGATFASSVSIFGGNLYFTNVSGTAVQITDGGALVSSPGNAQVFELQNVSSDLAISPSDTFVFIALDTTATRSVTLPLANSVPAGRIYIIKDVSGQANTNNITLNTSGSDQVDNQSSQILDSNCQSWTVVGDGVANWYIS